MGLIRIGMNARQFPGNWRPASAEIAFAQRAGFVALQFQGQEPGLDVQRLGEPFAVAAAALAAARIEAVMEIIVRIDAAGRTASGLTPLDVLELNLPAIDALPCTCVHLHLVPLAPEDDATLLALERSLVPQLAAGVALGEAHGFRLGIEHNEPRIGLCAIPERCAALLDAVPGLGFVWDTNHTAPEHLAGFLALTSRMTMLHVSDTRLPTVNDHYPLGMGTIDFPAYCRALLDRHFDGPAILEIGGLPQSGGYGRDTDAALIDSLHQLEAALTPDPFPILPRGRPEGKQDSPPVSGGAGGGKITGTSASLRP
ncbi:MAG: sugar phosphate isomerase/epimerase family protein [Thermomicrobiales bacterium]